jgi:hypothetical protein
MFRWRFVMGRGEEIAEDLSEKTERYLYKRVAVVI